MSTVCAAALLGGLVDLDVLDNQVAGIQTLGVGVGLSVLEQAREELGRLDWPAGLGDTELLAYDTFVSVCVVHCISFLQCILAHGAASFLMGYVPWAVRPVLPAYLLIGTASSLFCTFWR